MDPWTGEEAVKMRVREEGKKGVMSLGLGLEEEEEAEVEENMVC